MAIIAIAGCGKTHPKNCPVCGNPWIECIGLDGKGQTKSFECNECGWRHTAPHESAITASLLALVFAVPAVVILAKLMARSDNDDSDGGFPPGGQLALA